VLTGKTAAAGSDGGASTSGNETRGGSAAARLCDGNSAWPALREGSGDSTGARLKGRWLSDSSVGKRGGVEPVGAMEAVGTARVTRWSRRGDMLLRPAWPARGGSKLAHGPRREGRMRLTGGPHGNNNFQD
jgi:hypothetical protein